LGGLKNNEPASFDGRKDESYKAWAKSVKAYCEHDTEGFREALEWAENEASVIDADTVELMSWEDATTANKQLYNLLESLCVLDALVQVEKTKGLGFEAWRALKTGTTHPAGGSSSTAFARCWDAQCANHWMSYQPQRIGWNVTSITTPPPTRNLCPSP
jgi:hypothetical protein